MKSSQHNFSAGKYKLNPKWDHTAHLPEWLKLKRMSIQSTDKDMKWLELSYIDGRYVNRHDHFEKRTSAYPRTQQSHELVKKNEIICFPKSCTRMSTVAVRKETWKQLLYPSTREWISKCGVFIQCNMALK